MLRKVIAESRELHTVAENNTLTSTDLLLDGEGIKLFRMRGDTGQFIRSRTAASQPKTSERAVVTTKGLFNLRIWDDDDENVVVDETGGAGRIGSSSSNASISRGSKGFMRHDVLADDTEWFCLVTSTYTDLVTSIMCLLSGDELPAVPDNSHVIYALIEGTVDLDGVAENGPTIFLDDPDAASDTPGVITCTTDCTFIRVLAEKAARDE